MRGSRMKKVIRSENLPDHGTNAIESGGLDAARGLLIGLAISQVFWVALAIFLF